jgi:L-arabinokinase
MIARRSRRTRQDVRRILGLNDSRPVVLLSFGGFEIQGIDFDRVERLDQYCFLTTQPTPRPLRNVRVVTLDGLQHVDLVAQADAVITKPGYGIVSDCLANRVRVLYTARGEFAEYGPLVAGLERYGIAAFIETGTSSPGPGGTVWTSCCADLPCGSDLPAHGAETAARILRAHLA